MSTLDFGKNNFSSTPPKWSCSIPEQIYHRDAGSGRLVSASMLKHFRRCPAYYHALVNGSAAVESTPTFRIGRAVHKLVLEGERAYRNSFVVGGPFNAGTGRSFGHDTRAFRVWAEEYGLDPDRVVTPTEEAEMRRMEAAVRRHDEAGKLLHEGWPECSVRAEVEGVSCQARFDWLRPDGVAIDLKTTGDLSRFEQDARRFGYLHQFAFYRDVARSAGAGEVDMVAVIVEKRVPHRVGVWRFDPAVLEPYALQNRAALRALARCRGEGVWPTGYEGARAFPPAGLPPLWLN